MPRSASVSGPFGESAPRSAATSASPTTIAPRSARPVNPPPTPRVSTTSYGGSSANAVAVTAAAAAGPTPPQTQTIGPAPVSTATATNRPIRRADVAGSWETTAARSAATAVTRSSRRGVRSVLLGQHHAPLRRRGELVPVGPEPDDLQLGQAALPLGSLGLDDLGDRVGGDGDEVVLLQVAHLLTVDGDQPALMGNRPRGVDGHHRAVGADRHLGGRMLAAGQHDKRDGGTSGGREAAGGHGRSGGAVGWRVGRERRLSGPLPPWAGPRGWGGWYPRRLGRRAGPRSVGVPRVQGGGECHRKPPARHPEAERSVQRQRDPHGAADDPGKL